MEVVPNTYSPPPVPLLPGIEIYRDKFRELVEKSLVYMKSCAPREPIRISASKIFLDKIPKLVGMCHPAIIQANQMKGDRNTYALLEIARHVSRLEANFPVQKWLETECNSFTYYVILDRWRQTQIDDEELDTFACGMGEAIKGMKPGEKFNFPLGSLAHATRLHFVKNNDGSFDLIHFNTGDGPLTFNWKVSTAYKFPSVPAHKLEDPETWRQLTRVQYERTMQPAIEFLIKLGGAPVDIDAWLKKPPQMSGSCIYMAVLAEFKYSFITSFSNFHEGWYAYKQCKIAMLSRALEQDSDHLSPIQKSLMETKLALQKRYLESSDPSLIRTYIDALLLTGKHTQEDCEAEILGLSLPMSLSVLDKKLSQCLDFASYDFLNKMPPFLGKKQRAWIQSAREDFPKTAAFLTELALRDELIQEGVEYDLCTLAYYLAKSSPVDTERAFSLVESLKPAQKEHVLVTACQFSVDSGNFPWALHLASLVTGNQEKTFIIEYLLIRAFQYDQNYRLKEILLLIGDEQDKNGALEYWATCCLINGKSQWMKALAELATESIAKSRILLNICQLESDKGNVFEAVAYAHKIKSEPERSAACNYIYSAMIKLNRFDEAEIIKSSLLLTIS